jgi:dUTP pyrophosphatase
MKVKIVNKSGFENPSYATVGGAGLDLRSTQDIHLEPQERKLVGTGLYIALPIGYEAQIRPRSGWALKKGITVLNTPGTIDADYRGEIGVILYNSSNEAVDLKRGDKIAQMVIARYEQCIFENVDILDETSRGDGGFGHSDNNQ